MGDKGGKKARDRMQKQKAKKKEVESKKRQDKNHKPPAA